MRRDVLNLSVNFGLLFSGLVLVFSGLLIQIYYHIRDLDCAIAILEVNHKGWSLVHKISSIIFSIFILYHIIVVQKWYKVMIKKKLYSKHIQVITFSVICVIVSLTGFIPWGINLIKDGSNIRIVFIEIHDKIALLFLVYLLLHVFQRLKWFITCFDKN